MYNDYFGFSDSPFENNLDQRFLFLSEDHKEVLAALLYFVKERKGLAIVCGDVGTGKTMLINSFLNRLPDSVRPILISNPLASYLDLLHFIAREIGISDRQENILELMEQIKEALIAARNQGQDYILIVDEAHLFPDDSLEQVRLLSNIEVPDSKLLQILLVGQYELSHNLNRPEMRQLRQRINISRFLSPLSPAETKAYIDHRLQRVGSSFTAVFEPQGEQLLYQLTSGVPRRINQLCDNALLSCMTEDLKKVNRRVLQKSHEALLTDIIFTPKASSKYFGMKKASRWLIPLAAGAVFLIIGLGLGQTGWDQQHIRKESDRVDVASKLPLPSVSEPAPLTSNPATRAAPATVHDKETEMAPHKPAGKLQGDLNPKPLEPGLPKSGTRPSHAILSEKRSASGLAGSTSSTTETVVAKAENPTSVSGPVAADSIQRPEQVEVKPNDNLTRIASNFYPKNEELGLEAILLANPETINEDLIITGQKLNIPKINPDDQTIILRENLFYAAYGRYSSMSSLQTALSYLSQRGARYLVLNTKNNQGYLTHRVLVGGYENRNDLNKALQRIKADSE